MSFQAGIDLFNEQEFWHAHEQWEACWLKASGIEREFYQGLIQTAAALVKWQQGSRRGLQLNWAKARTRLLPIPSPYAGIDLARLIAHMDAMILDDQIPPPLPL